MFMISISIPYFASCVVLFIIIKPKADFRFLTTEDTENGMCVRARSYVGERVSFWRLEVHINHIVTLFLASTEGNCAPTDVCCLKAKWE